MKINDDYMIGENVYLSEQTLWNTSDVMNPLNTIGTVVDKDGSWVYVDWSNTEEGITNCYKRFDCDFKPEGEQHV